MHAYRNEYAHHYFIPSYALNSALSLSVYNFVAALPHLLPQTTAYSSLLRVLLPDNLAYLTSLLARK